MADVSRRRRRRGWWRRSRHRSAQRWRRRRLVEPGTRRFLWLLRDQDLEKPVCACVSACVWGVFVCTWIRLRHLLSGHVSVCPRQQGPD